MKSTIQDFINNCANVGYGDMESPFQFS